MHKNTKYQENRKIWLNVTERKSEYTGLTEKSSIRAFAMRAKNTGGNWNSKILEFCQFRALES